MFLCFFFHQFFSQIYISGEAQIFGEENITTVPKSDEESKISTRKLCHKERYGIAVTERSSDIKVKKIIEYSKKISHINSFRYHKLPDPDKSFGTSQSPVFSSFPASVFKLKFLQSCWVFDAHIFSYDSREKSEGFTIGIFHSSAEQIFSVRPPPFSIV